MIIWLTGQPGAGKTVLVKLLYSYSSMDSRLIIIDGDDLREVFNNQNYTEEGRRKNIELAQNIAKFLHHKNFTVLVSMVSPYRDQREAFKKEMGKNITELYVHTTDIRGREHFHVENYEPPLENFIDVDTTNESSSDTYKKVIKKLGYL